MSKEKNKPGEAAVTGTEAGQGDAAGAAAATAAEDPKDKEIAELREKLAKETKDKEIYKNGLLSAKKLVKAPKATPETIKSPEALESFLKEREEHRTVEAIPTGEPGETAAVAIAPAGETTEQKLRRELDEAAERERALRSQIGSGAGSAAVIGSPHSSNDEKPRGFWSDEDKQKLADIYRSRGFYTEEQISQMVKVAEDTAARGAATTEHTSKLHVRRDGTREGVLVARKK